jgi:hypothetical protein
MTSFMLGEYADQGKEKMCKVSQLNSKSAPGESGPQGLYSEFTTPQAAKIFSDT